jgi:hypothetical protein
MVSEYLIEGGEKENIGAMFYFLQLERKVQHEKMVILIKKIETSFA